jgi:GTP:adenosylcobinamide-phosphate guanylyltransferase
MTETRTLVLIPARMAASRLPGKPLLDLAGLPMIVHVLRRAEAAQIGRVAVATDTPEIAAVVKSHGFEAVMTRADHPSGSDRIYEALGKLDPRREAEIVVNLQGDFPTILPDNIRSVLAPLADPAVDIATLAAEIHTEEENTNPNVVKMVGSLSSCRSLCLSPCGAGAFRGAAALAAGTAGETGAIAGDGSRDADRRHDRRHRAARRRYSRRSCDDPSATGENLSGCYKAPRPRQ